MYTLISSKWWKNHRDVLLSRLNNGTMAIYVAQKDGRTMGGSTHMFPMSHSPVKGLLHSVKRFGYGVVDLGLVEAGQTWLYSQRIHRGCLGEDDDIWTVDNPVQMLPSSISRLEETMCSCLETAHMCLFILLFFCQRSRESSAQS
uniref:Uncharacterized protein n=1 Tax=Scleropages formosus TaxID=113540 RepID=A0A8C9R4X5_SCLFO